MRREDILHFNAKAYWARIMDPNLMSLEELRAKEEQKRGEIEISEFGGE